ncbi:MAG: hypothetical protein DRO62_02105 [Candidatus Altiarchaeales archaeon]|nr:MAG: hypothetical protein DRO62_02105 [Candidatus Altiarchaeales archaeon]
MNGVYSANIFIEVVIPQPKRAKKEILLKGLLDGVMRFVPIKLPISYVEHSEILLYPRPYMCLNPSPNFYIKFTLLF